MIALNDEHTDACTAQAHHLLAEEQASMEVLPVAVVEVAGEENEVNALRERLIDQTFERTTGSSPQPCDRGAVVSVKAAQGTVDMQI